MPTPRRLLEIFPGALTWCTLLFPLVGAFYYPEIVAIFILVYVSLWFFRSMEFSVNLIKSYILSERNLRKNWKKLYSYIDNNSRLQKDIASCTNRKERKFLIKTQEKLQNIKKLKQFKSFRKIKHIAIIATYTEEVDVLEETVNAIKASNYDLKNIYVVIATEERDKERALKNVKILKEKYKDVFGGFYSFMHPANIPGEVKGKGGNITFSGRKMLEIVKKENNDLSNFLVTTLDADNKVHPDYFACLTYHYLLTPNRKKRSYQPLPLFYNNIWDVPILNRMVAISNSFWHLFESGRPDRLRNFSSHAQSLDALVDMDFWNPKTIVEDGHQYWRAFFCYNGDHKVIPLFIPVYQDAVMNHSYFLSLSCQYKQLRRWAWGASDIPFVIVNLWKKRKEMRIGNSILQLIRLIEGHYMWATAPIIITMATPVPRMLNFEFQQTVFGNNLAYVLSNIFSYALVGILVSMVVSLLMLPKPPKGVWYRVSSIIQWVLVPLTTIFFGSIPAIDSQTRLMIGKYMDFNVTEKVRKGHIEKSSLNAIPVKA